MAKHATHWWSYQRRSLKIEENYRKRERRNKNDRDKDTGWLNMLSTICPSLMKLPDKEKKRWLDKEETEDDIDKDRKQEHWRSY